MLIGSPLGDNNKTLGCSPMNILAGRNSAEGAFEKVVPRRVLRTILGRPFLKDTKAIPEDSSSCVKKLARWVWRRFLAIRHTREPCADTTQVPLAAQHETQQKHHQKNPQSWGSISRWLLTISTQGSPSTFTKRFVCVPRPKRVVVVLLFAFKLTGGNSWFT